MENIISTYFDSPLGVIQISGTTDIVTQVLFHDEEQRIDLVSQEKNIPETISNCINQLNEFFTGRRTTFDLPLKPEGTPFQMEVWKILATIPFGGTMSYLELSKKFGDVKAIRAVAAANGKNPLAIIVPCHRVIGSKGDLTGYAGKLWRKQWLLNHESAIITRQQSLFAF